MPVRCSLRPTLEQWRGRVRHRPRPPPVHRTAWAGTVDRSRRGRSTELPSRRNAVASGSSRLEHIGALQDVWGGSILPERGDRIETGSTQGGNRRG